MVARPLSCNLTGFLSELAAIGYRRFRERLLNAIAAAGHDGSARIDAMAAWSLVHGFAVLMIDERLPREVPVDALLTAVLARLVLR